MPAVSDGMGWTRPDVLLNKTLHDGDRQMLVLVEYNDPRGALRAPCASGVNCRVFYREARRPPPSPTVAEPYVVGEQRRL